MFLYIRFSSWLQCLLYCIYESAIINSHCLFQSIIYGYIPLVSLLFYDLAVTSYEDEAYEGHPVRLCFLAIHCCQQILNMQLCRFHQYGMAESRIMKVVKNNIHAVCFVRYWYFLITQEENPMYRFGSSSVLCIVDHTNLLINCLNLAVFIAERQPTRVKNVLTFANCTWHRYSTFLQHCVLARCDPAQQHDDCWKGSVAIHSHMYTFITAIPHKLHSTCTIACRCVCL